MSINKHENEESNWMSYSDIMTGLMVIFMFISIYYILQTKKQKEDFKKTKVDLYNELKKEFQDDFKKWKVILDDDLSIKFTDPKVLFRYGKAFIRKEFKNKLNSFFPRYFDILLKQKYKNKIKEIRIEGHTDRDKMSENSKFYDSDPYIANIKLSQMRSTNILKYFRKMTYHDTLPNEKKKYLEFLLTANGLSYGKTVDDDDNYTLESKKQIDNKKSRRVEFRIVTNSEKLAEDINILNQKNN